LREREKGENFGKGTKYLYWSAWGENFEKSEFQSNPKLKIEYDSFFQGARQSHWPEDYA